MQGVLLIDKPAGWTSFDVVNYTRRIVAVAEGKKPKQVKVGHTGTLDPFATGLLVLLVGKDYTRRAGELSKLDKTYELTMRLGQTSTTGDPEGEISESATGVTPDRITFEKALATLQGLISQTPPAFSAIKVDGQRAYTLARQGKAVSLEPRKVTIHRLELLEYTYPEAILVAEVSSGTYIRSLVEDLGKTLGTGAYTLQLCRTQVGKFSLDGALQVSELSGDTLHRFLTAL